MMARSNLAVVGNQMRQEERFLRILSDPWYEMLVGVQDALTRSLQFFQQRELKSIHLPITTHSISSPMGLGSDSKPVAIDLFGVPTYLADSMQFMLEYGCRISPSGCYYMMPSFRGEQADETHLCQFYHIEAEILGCFDDVTQLVEDYVRAAAREVLSRCGTSIRRLVGTTSHIESVVDMDSFPRVTIDEAFDLLGGDSQYFRISTEPKYRSLTRRGEQELMRRMNGVVWVTHPDHLSVPFYQAFADDSRTSALAGDLLLGLGELVGCGERHTHASDVFDALKLHDVDPEPYRWYTQMREQRALQTAGFGLGTERFICWLLQHQDIRDCQLLPRYNGQAVIP